MNVDYRTADGYFVRNHARDVAVELKIESKSQFDSIFGMATTMSSQPTAIDFAKDYALAVILRETDRPTKITVDSLQWTGQKIDLYYSVAEGNPQSYTMRPALILLVDRKYDGKLDATANAYTQQPEQAAGIMALPIKDGKATATVMKKEREPVTFSFQSGDYTHLKGKLTSPSDTANIRFNQITMPNGNQDGPFSREIDYELTQPGTYQLSIGESLMAGDPWGGEFTIEIELTDKK